MILIDNNVLSISYPYNLELQDVVGLQQSIMVLIQKASLLREDGMYKEAGELHYVLELLKAMVDETENAPMGEGNEAMKMERMRKNDKALKAMIVGSNDNK